MAFEINTNILAINALRNLGSTQSAITKTMTRLQTGLKINEAADDPSGLIATEGMRAQIASMDQASKNSQAAINYVKTAEGGLAELNGLLTKARTLAVANGNGTLDTAQKAANQTQLDNLFRSIDRISRTTQFNGRNLLDGSAGIRSEIDRTDLVSSAVFGQTFGGFPTQEGAMSLTVTSAATKSVSSATGAATGAAATAALGVDGTFVINGKSFSYLGTDKFSDVVQQINLASSEVGVTAVWDTDHVSLVANDYGSVAIAVSDTGGALKATAGSLGTTLGADMVASVTVGSTTQLMQAKGLELFMPDGTRVKTTAAANQVGLSASIGRVVTGSSQFQIGGNAGQTANLSIGNYDSESLGFAGGRLDITGSDMSAALHAIDAAISMVSNGRAQIGSFMTDTLESNIRTLATGRQNLQSSLSMIRDADMAEEMTDLTRLQILSQAGTAMLGQANQAPQNILRLISG